MSGILDSLSPALRHFVLILVGAVITAALANQDVVLAHVPTALVPVAGALIAVFATYITPFTAQYGVGSASTSNTFPDTAGDSES